MNRVRQVLGIIAITALIVSATLGVGARAAAAPSLTLFAATGCSLPDGSTNGVYQTDGRTCCPPGTENDAKQCLYAKYINPLIVLLSAAVGVVVVIAIVYGAIEYATSQGDPKRMQSGKQHITNALLALVAFILLYAFLQFILPGGVLNG